MQLPEHEIVLHEAQILERIRSLAADIAHRHEGLEVVLVGVMKGGLPFLTHLATALEKDGRLKACYIETLAAESYGDSCHPGDLRLTSELRRSIKGQHVFIVEDLADTCATLKFLKAHVLSKQPASCKIAVLMNKPSGCLHPEVQLDYVGFTVAGGFLVGFGLDWKGACRGLPNVVRILDPN